MNANFKSWIKISVVAAIVGILYFWVKVIPPSTEGQVPVTYTSQNVLAPGPGQKKVVLKNLGMT